MPTCRLCERSFTKWRQLKLHIESGACPTLGGSSFKLSPQTADYACIARHASEKPPPAHLQASRTETVPMDSDQPLVLRQSFHKQLNSWENLLSCRETRTLLSSRCVMCNMWVASSRHIKQHYNKTHHQEYPQILPITETLCQSFKGHFTRGKTCKFCGSCVGAPCRHTLQCTVLHQLCLAVTFCRQGLRHQDDGNKSERPGVGHLPVLHAVRARSHSIPRPSGSDFQATKTEPTGELPRKPPTIRSLLSASATPSGTDPRPSSQTDGQAGRRTSCCSSVRISAACCQIS